MKKLTFLLFLVFATNLYASNWEKIYFIPQTDATLFIDKDSIVRSSSIVNVWQKIEYNKIWTFEGKFTYNASNTNLSVNCSTREVATKTFMLLYKGNPSYVSDISTYPSLNKFLPIVPDSVDEQIFNYVCKK